MWSASRRRGAIAALGALLCVLPVAPAVAVSDVDVGTDTITITVKIDLIGGSRRLANRWERAIRGYWNDGPGLGNWEYCGLEVEFVPDIEPVGAGEAGRMDAHPVFPEAPSRRGSDFIDHVLTPGSYDPTAENAAGFWGTESEDWVIAHEFGHLLGLPDEYEWVQPDDDLNGNGVRDPDEGVTVSPELQDSLMGDGGRMHQRYIDTLVSQHLGEFDAGCRTWTGMLSAAHAIRDGAGGCTFGWLGVFTVTVTAENTVSGVAQTAGDGCGAQAGPVTITGTRDEAGFTLSSDSFILAEGTRVEDVDPGSAAGESSYSDAYNTVTTEIHMQCLDCD